MACVHILLKWVHLVVRWLSLIATCLIFFVFTQHPLLIFKATAHPNGPVSIVLCCNFSWIHCGKFELSEPRQSRDNNRKVNMEATYLKTLVLSGTQWSPKLKPRQGDITQQIHLYKMSQRVRINIKCWAYWYLRTVLSPRDSSMYFFMQ